MGVKIVKKIKAFTLVETIIVLGVVALALPALFSIFFVVLQQQVKVYRLTEVKKQGDAVLKQVEAKVKSEAKTITGCSLIGRTCTSLSEQCYEAGQRATVSVFNWEGGGPNDRDWFGVVHVPADNNIELIGNIGVGLSGAVDLTDSNKVIVDNYSFTCFKKDSFTAPVVTLSFDICYKADTAADSCYSMRPEETALLNYSTVIQLRNPSLILPTGETN